MYAIPLLCSDAVQIPSWLTQPTYIGQSIEKFIRSPTLTHSTDLVLHYQRQSEAVVQCVVRQLILRGRKYARKYVNYSIKRLVVRPLSASLPEDSSLGCPAWAFAGGDSPGSTSITTQTPSVQDSVKRSVADRYCTPRSKFLGITQN